MHRWSRLVVLGLLLASIATPSRESHALIIPPHGVIGVFRIKAVDASGRFVVFPGTTRHPSGNARDLRYDRLTGETIEIDPVDAASADLRFAITRGETFPHTDPRWLEIDTGIEHPIGIPLPPGYYVSARDLSADGRLLLGAALPASLADPSSTATYVVSIDGSVDRSPIPGVTPVDLSPNGRWVLMRTDCPAPFAGAFCSKYSRWDRATGNVHQFPVREGSVIFAVGDEGQVLESEALAPVGVDGDFPSRLVRRTVRGQVFELIPSGEPRWPLIASDDLSAIALVDRATPTRIVIVDTATAARTVHAFHPADGMVISPDGSFVMAIPFVPRSNWGNTTADLTVFQHDGRQPPPRVRAGEVVVVPIAGQNGVPLGATSVALNVTMTNPSGPGFAVAWPCDETRPEASNVNVTGAQQTVSNAVIMKVASTGPDAGSVCLSSSVATDIIVDTQGWFVGDGYRGVVPARLIDTRRGEQDSLGNVPGGGIVPVSVRVGAVPSGARAVVLNVTMTNTEGPGFATVWPCDEAQPDASNINVTGAGRTVANAVVVKVGSDGTICVATSTRADVIVDVQGFFAGVAYSGITPERFLDTRAGDTDSVGNVTEQGVVSVPVAGVGGVASDASAVVLNVTVTNPAGPGFAAVWPCDEERPVASNVNYSGSGVTVANAVISKVATSGASAGAVCLFSSANADLIVDVQGSFTGSAYVGMRPARFLDTRG